MISLYGVLSINGSFLLYIINALEIEKYILTIVRKQQTTEIQEISTTEVAGWKRLKRAVSQKHALKEQSMLGFVTQN